MWNNRRFGGKNVRDPNFRLTAIRNERNQLSEENANKDEELVKKDIIIVYHYHCTLWSRKASRPAQAPGAAS